MRIRLCIVVFFTIVCARAQQDTLICEKDYSDLKSWTYKGMLRKEFTGSFTVNAGDSLRYIVFREKKHRTSFSILDSKGKEVIAQPMHEKTLTGKVDSVKDVSYFFILKSKSLLPNSFIVTIRKKSCAYQKKVVVPVPPSPPPPVFVTEITDTLILKTEVYLASKLNMKSKQRFLLPVDSLLVPSDTLQRPTEKFWRSELRYTIKSPGGPVRYTFEDAAARSVQKGSGTDEKGSIPVKGIQKSYSLLIENDDTVAGKRVEIQVRQWVYRRIPQKTN